ncbi:IS481 family transposase [Rhizobium rhizogenes]|uniref:IS481 family transposase n=1 Tax=Rhizobium rhizogenes TaxID=359 RepID=A0AA92C4Y2_RHIRH|nr:IS481 family transposase [Rhizobium rhizogenes]PVE55480.1 IS481 family transposase [Rhizobium rhizogenes]PVE65597.1 IS481 family transposase [Agrobacterium tumefaciens]PVE75661.1 IS481 family transposase [Sphingomonas sp. TPD3009]
MPWRETSVMEERLRFVARLLEGEGMSEVCRDFGISRKTGYKIFNRYKDDGLEALTDRSRRPVRYANQLPDPVEAMIVRLKKEKPHWGARKIRELLVKKLAGDVRIPASSTVHAVLDRHGLVRQARKRNRANKAMGTTLSQAVNANDLWCADFKGEFKLGNGRYCYPLTVTDQASRYLLACEAFESTREQAVIEAFRRLFAEHGLPQAIRSDNGLPFASPNGLYNLSKLSVFWLRLGIAIERIKPGHPQQNGRHERMHLTLKKEATRPPERNLLQQQVRFDAFVSEFNGDRPHEAIGMKVPADLYTSSLRPYLGLPEIEYPFHDRDIIITNCGRACLYRKKINISTVLAGQKLGLKEVEDGIWIVSFMHYDLGYIDLEQRTLQTIDNPFGTRLSPMS